MPHVPLYFEFQQLVVGNDFTADVKMRGRVTCTEEFGSVWSYGVNPGGIAGYGEDMKSAYANFRINVAGALFDMASWADGFEDFRKEVSRFLSETDSESVAEWEDARRAVRDGQNPCVESPCVEKQDLDPALTVEKLEEQLSPALNRLPEPSVVQGPQERLAYAA